MIPLFSRVLSETTELKVKISVESVHYVICHGSIGVCQGDPGGAVMMFTSSHQWVLIGLISYGYLCYNRGFPTLRIRIKAFLRWMQSMNVTDTFTMSTNATATTITTRLITVSRTTTSTRRATKTTKNASHRFPLCFCLLVVAILVNLGKARIE